MSTRKVIWTIAIALAWVGATSAYAFPIEYLSADAFVATSGQTNYHLWYPISDTGETGHEYGNDSWNLEEHGPDASGVFDEAVEGQASVYILDDNRVAWGHAGAAQTTSLEPTGFSTAGTASVYGLEAISDFGSDWGLESEASAEAISALELVFEVPQACRVTLEGSLFCADPFDTDALVALSSLSDGVLFSWNNSEFCEEIVLLPGEVYTFTSFASSSANIREYSRDWRYATYECALTVEGIIPEPATWALLSMGLVAMGVARARRAR